jgi:uncharacterized protein (DUF1330 family)
MKYYAVAEIEITERSWVSAYVKNVTGMVERHGGRYLARTSRIEQLEGERKVPQLSLIIEWPSKEAAEAFYHSEEYRPYLESRKAGSKGTFVLVAGEDSSHSTARNPALQRE